MRAIAALVCASALVLAACGPGLPFDTGAAVDDLCTPNAPPAIARGAGAPAARDIAIPIESFPLCGYAISSDAALGATGWDRIFRPADPSKANFVFVSVQTFILGGSERGSTYVARRTADTFHWADSTPTVTEVAADVAGDGAKAFVADFGQGKHKQYFYVTGYDGYGIEIGIEPSRAGVDATIALARLVAVARGQLAFAGLVYATWLQLPVATAAAGASTPSPSFPPCTSQYDGTYVGQATYEYEYFDWGKGVTVRGGTHTVDFTIVFRCEYKALDHVVLAVTHASSSDPYFGAPGLVAVSGTANLPAVPLSSSTPEADVVSVTFPNGSLVNFLRATVPSPRGDTLVSGSGGPVPPWGAANPNVPVGAFPLVPAGMAPRTTFHGWSFTRSF